MKDSYIKQAELLIDILAEFSKVDAFVLHGGTAINLFHLDMPRLSVDIDLTYVGFSDNRESDLKKVRDSLELIKTKLKKRFPGTIFNDERRADEELKILCNRNNVIVKVEVNQINRGLIADPCSKALCPKAEHLFNRFCEINTVSIGQLWGGKLNAALERQHPRDIFDVKNMLRSIGFTQEIKDGFLFFLLCAKRPIDEILNPNFVNQSAVFQSQFSGMTDETFSYTDFEETRKELVKIIYNSLTDNDKELLISFALGSPKWKNCDYSNFPAIKWKLLNINKLKATDPDKHIKAIAKLERLFE